jgi:alpha-L-rhamnosidase
LQPQPNEKLSHARAHLDTLHGRIESAWKHENGTFSYRFVVPPNTSATIALPNGESREVEAGVYEGEFAL